MDTDLEILNSIIFKNETTLINIQTFENKQRDLKQYLSNNRTTQQIPRPRLFGNIQSGYVLSYTDRSNNVEVLTDLLLMNNLTGNANLVNMFMNVDPGSLQDVPTPLDTKTMNHFPIKKFSECDDLENDMCAICQSKYEGDDLLTILPCNGNHRYHQGCIEEWLSRFSKKCPSCRQNLEDL